MATSIQNLVQPFSCRCPSYTSPSIPIAIFSGGRSRNARKMLRICGAMVEKTVQGASSTFAKEMERLSAKESLLLAIENKFIISTKYSVEGPLRMKEEYVEGTFESPKVNEEVVPEQLRGAFGQAFNTLQQLPVPIRDAVSSGMKVPLGIRRSRKWCCNPLQRLSMETSTTANQTIWLRRTFQGSWELQLQLRSSVITSQQLLLQKIQCRLQHGQTMYIPGRFQAIRRDLPETYSYFLP